MFSTIKRNESRICRLPVIFAAIFLSQSVCANTFGTDDDSWIQNVRNDHPRLFFNEDMWPEIRKRALTEEKNWYAELKKRVDRYPDNPTIESEREDYAYRQRPDGEYERIRLPRPTGT